MEKLAPPATAVGKLAPRMTEVEKLAPPETAVEFPSPVAVPEEKSPGTWFQVPELSLNTSFQVPELPLKARWPVSEILSLTEVEPLGTVERKAKRLVGLSLVRVKPNLLVATMVMVKVMAIF